jgi:hypothetical protein
MGDVLGPKEEHIQIVGRTSIELSAEESRHALWCLRCKGDVWRLILASLPAQRQAFVDLGATPLVLGGLDAFRDKLIEELETLAPGFQDEETDK